MINKLKNNLDCVTDVITFVLVFVKVILFFVGLPPRLLEGITKKDIGYLGLDQASRETMLDQIDFG